MGLIDRIRPHRTTPLAPGTAAGGAQDAPPPPRGADPAERAAALHRLRGTCPHCHKPQDVESATTWVTTPCSYCSAPVTLHA